MNSALEDRFEAAVRRRARAFEYPEVPEIAPAVRRALRQVPPRRGLRLLRAAALLAVLVAAVMLAVPEARALVAGWFRIGIVSILPEAPAHPLPESSDPVTTTPSSGTPLPPALRELSGLTTLEHAQEESGYRIRLPRYPVELGDPHLVFYQPRLDMVVLVWLDAKDSDIVQLSLYQLLSSNPVVNKIDPTVLAQTDVNGHPALWLEGPYPLEVRSGELSWRRIVEGRSLLWESDGITYRLESLLTLEESLKIAASLR